MLESELLTIGANNHKRTRMNGKKPSIAPIVNTAPATFPLPSFAIILCSSPAPMPKGWVNIAEIAATTVLVL